MKSVIVVGEDFQRKQKTNAHIYKQRANALDSRELQQNRTWLAHVQYHISTMVQKDNSFLVLFWIFILFGFLVACCGGAFYLIGEDSFKDNSSLFQAQSSEVARATAVLAGTVTSKRLLFDSTTLTAYWGSDQTLPMTYHGSAQIHGTFPKL